MGQTFGTKKARKAIASITENAISPDKSARSTNNKPAKIDAATAAVLAGMAEGAKAMASREELDQKSQDAKPRPIANKDAKDVQDVYTVDSLIGKDTFAAVPVRAWETALKSNKEIECSSRYVASRINKVATNVEKLRILRYMVLMLEVLNSCRVTKGNRTLPRRDELKRLLGDIPEAVLESIKRKFTRGELITKFHVDLMITHLCALACLVDNYEVDMFKLQEDLKLETKQMSQYFQEIGAKIGALGEAERKKQGLEKAAASQRKVAKLKLPLEYPKLPSGRRR